mgnify:CR=1 FL=1
MGLPTSETAAAAASQSLSWSDEGNAVVVRVPLPSSFSGDDKGGNNKNNDNDDDSAVVVDAGGGGLVVSLASPPKTELMRIVQLYGTVDASKVTKSVSFKGGKGGSGGGGEVVVTLPKLDESPDAARWPSLEASSSSSNNDDDSSSSGAAAALAEREHVARLLTAAKQGDFDELKAAAEKYRSEIDDAGDGKGNGDDGGGDATKKQSGVGAVKDGNGRSVLHFAVAGKNTACAEWLVDECGVDVNAMDDTSKPFSFFPFLSDRTGDG